MKSTARRTASATTSFIDEETGMMNDGPSGLWTVYGKGVVTLHGPGGEAVYRTGERFDLPRQNA